jgi:hypothetical protein
MVRREAPPLREARVTKAVKISATVALGDGIDDQ